MSFVIALIAFARRPLRSQFGDKVLKQLQERHTAPRQLRGRLSSISTAEFASVVGLFGMAALAETELAGLRKELQPPTGTGSSCGASCGSGCGGGCGGCGGGD